MKGTQLSEIGRGNDEGRKKTVRGRNTTVSCSPAKRIGHNINGCLLLGKQPYEKKKKSPTGNLVRRPRRIVDSRPTNVTI